MLSHIDNSGIVRALGCKPTPFALKLLMGSSPSSEPLIPQSEWREFDYSLIHPLIVKDQGQTSACQTHMDASVTEGTRWVAGQPHVALSAWWPYGMLTGGQDVGSSVGEGVHLISTKGLPPEADGDYGNFDPRTFTPEMAADALRFRTDRSEVVTDELTLMSHLQRGRYCGIAIPVGNDFSNLDDEGVAPLDYRITCNHAVALAPAAKRLKDRTWAVKLMNSWSPQWGLQGYAWIRLTDLFSTRYVESFASRSVRMDPKFPDLIPDITG